MLEALISLAVTIALIALLRPLWMWAFGINDVVDELRALRTELLRQTQRTASPFAQPLPAQRSGYLAPIPKDEPLTEKDKNAYSWYKGN